MNYALMRDWHLMCRRPDGAGVAWVSIRLVDPTTVVTWPTRQGAEEAAEIQGGATIIQDNQLPGVVC